MKQGKTLSMDELVDLYLEEMGLTRQFKEREVCQVWPDVVGGMIASRTKSLRISDEDIREFHFFRREERDSDGKGRVDKSLERPDW